MKKLLILVLIVFAGYMVHKKFFGKETIRDPRDGKSYEIVTIGTQTWMAENLNYEVADSYCFADKPESCKKYGRFYTWETAKKICPSGWHLPTRWEWEKLFNVAGGELAAGKKLKSSSGWRNRKNGTDEFGFSALPAGARIISENGYLAEGFYAVFCSSTETDYKNYYNATFLHESDGVAQAEGESKDLGCSVRCIKD